jgi:hypothetical protein
MRERENEKDIQFENEIVRVWACESVFVWEQEWVCERERERGIVTLIIRLRDCVRMWYVILWEQERVCEWETWIHWEERAIYTFGIREVDTVRMREIDSVRMRKIATFRMWERYIIWEWDKGSLRIFGSVCVCVCVCVCVYVCERERRGKEGETLSVSVCLFALEGGRHY